MGRQVGINIKDIRKKIPLTQEEMAEKLKLKTGTYGAKELKGNFTNSELKQISKILNTPVESLTEEDESLFEIADGPAILKNSVFLSNQQELINSQKKIISQLEEKIQRLQQELEEVRTKNTGGQQRSA